MIPMQAVPTSVAVRPHDPNIYVGQLTGFPFPPGAANVCRSSRTARTEVYASGFTNIMDIAWGRNGVAVRARDRRERPALRRPGPGALIKVWPNGRAGLSWPATGLVSPTAVAIGKDGTVYVTNNGTSASNGEVVNLGKV